MRNFDKRNQVIIKQINDLSFYALNLKNQRVKGLMTRTNIKVTKTIYRLNCAVKNFGLK